MPRSLRVLLVEDSEDDAVLVKRALRQDADDLSFERVEDGPAMRAALSRGTWDVVICDWSMPHFSALEALAVLKESGVELPFIIASGTVGEEMAVEAMRAGARDYVLKDKLVRLPLAVRREVLEFRTRRQSEEALRRSEDHLRQAQKMQAIGRLAGGVAHDFNNLLSVILTYSELLMQEAPEDSQSHKDLEAIHGASIRAAALTRQLLAFSRQQVLEPRVISLNETVEGMSDMLGRLVGDDIRMSVRSSPGLGSVNADPGQLEQVVMNLVINARDAMVDGGELVVETANVELDASHGPLAPGSYVMLSVTDTGMGMDPQVRAQIFEPFFTTKEKGKGTGLGLATVFGIIQQSHGHIDVTSAPGRGSTFKVYLPRSGETAGPATAPVAHTVSRRGDETVLLVEDDDQVRALVLGLLGRLGYRVLEARNAGEALLIWEKRTEPIHLLLSDVVMPHMGGVELAKRLRKDDAKLAVLCMSGYTGDAQEEITNTDIVFLQKPVTPDNLSRKLFEALGSVSRSPVPPE